MKKTSNKGFSMVELIIVIAIMAILAAALAPSLIKYINKSRLSTDITTGTSIADAASAAMAVEAANDDIGTYEGGTRDVNAILGDCNSNKYASEFASVLGVNSVKGKSKKDLAGTSLSNSFWISFNPGSNNVTVWYGVTDNDHIVVPNAGSRLSE